MIQTNVLFHRCDCYARRSVFVISKMMLASILLFTCISSELFCRKNKLSIGNGLLVSGFSSQSVRSGDSLVVYGQGFTENTQVKVNGSDARVLKSEPDRLVVVIPESAPRGKIEVFNGAISASSEETLAVLTRIEQNLSKNLRLTRDKTYLLTGNTVVNSGFSLTIDPGTVILCDYQSNASLTIAAGASIIAQGEVDQPIVFASNKKPGFRRPGDWKGIVLAGQSPTSDKSDVLKYVRIEYSGQNNSNGAGAAFYSARGLKEGNFDYVQVSYSEGDAFRFGGTSTSDAYLKHLYAYGCSGNDFSFVGQSRAYGQFLMSLKDPNYASQFGSDGLLVQTEKGVVVSNYSYIGYYGSARNLRKQIFSGVGVNITVNQTINRYEGRGAHVGGFDEEDGNLKSGSLRLYNSLIGAYALAGISIDGAAAWNILENGSETLESPNNSFANNYVARPLNSADRNPSFGALFSFLLGYPFRSNSTFTRENFTHRLSGFENIKGFASTNFFASRNDTSVRSDNRLLVPSVFITQVVDDLGLAELTDITFFENPVYLPQKGSILLQRASYDGTLLTSNFYDKVPFCGSFGEIDWTKKWVSTIPQTQAYN